MKQIKHEETEYINPLIDFGFKRIFGNERVMMGFLNALIQVDEPETEIVGLVFMLGVNSNIASRGHSLNFSLEFKGGTSTTVAFADEYTLEEIDSQIVPEI